MIKHILARLEGTAADRAVLACALQAARRFEAHIEALHVCGLVDDLPLVVGYGPAVDVSGIVETLERALGESAARARRHYDEWREAHRPQPAGRPATGAETSAAWREVPGREVEVIAHLGRLTDLIVLAQPVGEAGVSATSALEAALFDTSRPVLMVPEATSYDLFRNPLVAWNGSKGGLR